MFNVLMGIISTKAFYDYINIILLSIFLILIIYIAYKKHKILININLIIIIGFASTYYIISMIYEINVAKTSIACVLSYYIGMMIIELSKNSEKTIIKYTYSIAIGFFIHAMANYIINIGSQERNTIDIWTGLPRSATLQATMLTMIIGSSFYSIFLIKNKIYKSIMIICISLSLAYNLVLGTRTLIVILIVSFISSWITFMVLNRKKSHLLINNTKIIFTVLGIVLLIYNSNFIGIKEKIEDTKLLRRINKPYSTEQSDMYRVQNILCAINNIFKYPIGGNNEKIGNLKYVHNMWLDVANQTGFIPFTLLVIFTVISLWNIIKLVRSNKYTVKLKVFLVGIYISVLLNLSVEPILQGEPLFYIMFCNIIGMVDKCV